MIQPVFGFEFHCGRRCLQAAASLLNPAGKRPEKAAPQPEMRIPAAMLYAQDLSRIKKNPAECIMRAQFPEIYYIVKTAV